MTSTSLTACIALISCGLLAGAIQAQDALEVFPTGEEATLLHVPDKASVTLPPKAVVVIPIAPDKLIVVTPSGNEGKVPSLFGGLRKEAIVVMPSDQKAVVTYYWPGERGGRISVDGKRLHVGDAAVDFQRITKGSELTITGPNGTLEVRAVDRGGLDVINRKAARRYGLGVLVVDVWVASNEEALLAAKHLGSKGTVGLKYRN